MNERANGFLMEKESWTQSFSFVSMKILLSPTMPRFPTIPQSCSLSKVERQREFLTPRRRQLHWNWIQFINNFLLHYFRLHTEVHCITRRRFDGLVDGAGNACDTHSHKIQATNILSTYRKSNNKRWCMRFLWKRELILVNPSRQYFCAFQACSF